MLLAAAFFWGYRNFRHEILVSTQQRVEDRVFQVHEELLSANALYLDLVRASMKVLQNKGAMLGAPRIAGEATVDGKVVPGLWFGEQAMANWFGLVDQVNDLMGGTATIFVKSGDEFVRVCTNVQRQDASRAVGTILDPAGKAIAAIRQGKAFYGVVDILGRAYLRATNPFSTRGEKRLAFGMLAISLKHCPSWEAGLKKQKFWKTAILPCWTQSNRWFFILNTSALGRFSKLSPVGKSYRDREAGGTAPGRCR